MESPTILEFLQDRVDKHLVLSTIKVQIVALSVFWKDLYKMTCIKTLSRSRPTPRCRGLSRDLSIVLSKASLEPISEASLKLIT